ncbi:MAG TPA: HEAT repeat domain-containing protein, partial [Candidatus Caenarcaniphilales bacterium]
MSLINRNFLEQAQVAAQEQNWQRVNQYLQQVLEPNQAFAIPPTADEQAELEPVVSLALDVLVGGDFSARWEVAKTFPKLGTAVTAPLIGILEDAEADLELRWFAARILGGFECPEVVTALVELLKNDDQEDLMGMAAEALASLGPLAVAALSELLAQESTRLLAVRSLSQIRRCEIISPLLTVVQDPQVLVRATAIEALGSFHNSDIPPVLVSALTDSAAIVRRAAVSGLSFRADLLEELDLVNQIQPLLWDFDWEVCAAAASALGRLGTD